MNLFLASDPRPVHFVGIAGAGMSALALLALRRGVAVTGSDRAPEGAADLVALGATVLQGHDPSNLGRARAVIVSAAIPADNAEVGRARELGLPVVSRKQALAELVAGNRTVGIAGTHGKTTTTVMTTLALAAAGHDPTGLAGGRVDAWGGNARIGGDDPFVVEADEYDQAFLELSPDIAVVTNVESEHLECYGGSVQAMEAAFGEFAGRAPLAIIGTADRGSTRVRDAIVARPTNRTRIWRFGPGPAEIAIRDERAAPQGSEARVTLPDAGDVTLRLRVPGRHNLLNAAAALGVVAATGGNLDAAVQALGEFTGVGRRFERRGEAAGVAVVDDYAHHATELAATLAAARQAYPGRRIVAVFQPHLFSRTAAQHGAMGAALAGADLAIVTEVYAAREEPIAGVTGRLVADAVTAKGGAARFVPDRDRLADELTEACRPGDVVLTLGAGDITSLGPALLQRLGGTAA